MLARLMLPLAFIVSLAACGGGISEGRAEGMHDVLNVVTDVVDPLYEGAVGTCDATEGYVIQAAESRQEAESDIAEIRGICDRIFAGFESVRAAQRAARSAVDALRADVSSNERFVSAITAVQALQVAATQAKEIWAQEKERLAAFRQGGDS